MKTLERIGEAFRLGLQRFEPWPGPNDKEQKEIVDAWLILIGSAILIIL